MLQVIDNFIDPLICKAIYLNVLRSPMFIQTPKGKEKDPSFFMAEISEQDNIVLYLLLKAQQIFKKDLKCLRSYANVQFKGQHSNWHIDDGDFTILLMVSETLNDGKFEIGDQKVDFKENRCVIFNAKEKHRGLASEYAKLPRCTLAIKTEIINGNN